MSRGNADSFYPPPALIRAGQDSLEAEVRPFAAPPSWEEAVAAEKSRNERRVFVFVASVVSKPAFRGQQWDIVSIGCRSSPLRN